MPAERERAAPQTKGPGKLQRVRTARLGRIPCLFIWTAAPYASIYRAIPTALRVRAGAKLRCPACIVTTTLDEAERRAPRGQSDEAVAEVTVVARRAMPTEGGGGPSTRPARGRDGGRGGIEGRRWGDG